MLKPYTEYKHAVAVKPSIGPKPRSIHDSARRIELLTALLAREEQDGTTPTEWIKEYLALLPNHRSA